MLSVRSNLSYLSKLPFELRENLLLLLPPKEIVSKVFEIEAFKRVRNQETFWERVWRKWVSSRLPDSRNRSIRDAIYWRVEEAKRLTPEKLLKEGFSREILFYVGEALERDSNEKDGVLIGAAIKGSLDIVRYVVEIGANISARGDEALRRAVFCGHLDIVKYLVEKGANISAREDDALRAAAANGHLDIVRYLVEKGANISVREDAALRRAAFEGHFDIVQYLVKSGANISARNNEVLRWAAEKGYFEIVRYLIESGADPQVLDEIISPT